MSDQEECVAREEPLEPSTQVGMLNERQKQVLIDRLNDDVDLPLLSEEKEQRMIENLVERVHPHVEPALGLLLPELYLSCIKLALNEELHIKKRRKLITKMLRGELAGPLARELNERVDLSHVPERLEGVVLKVVANKIIGEFVEWTVGAVDDFMNEEEGGGSSSDSS